jgi:hypothetical protein
MDVAGTTGGLGNQLPRSLVEPDNTEKERPIVTTAVAPASTLTATDRCDRCGAQAYLRVELASGFDLLFCAHHAREHEDKLRAVAVNVHDETHKLAPSAPVIED